MEWRQEGHIRVCVFPPPLFPVILLGDQISVLPLSYTVQCLIECLTHTQYKQWHKGIDSTEENMQQNPQLPGRKGAIWAALPAHSKV